MDFTPSQKKFINSNSNYIIVSAGAGSGKTTALLYRIINLINNGAKLEEMIITTFTKAAALDLKYKMMTNNIKSETGYIEISTFHALAARIVREYFYFADIDPTFIIAAESDSSVLMKEAIEEVIDDKLNQNEKIFNEFYSVFLFRHKYKKLLDMLEEIFNKCAAKYEGINELKKLSEIYNDESYLQDELNKYNINFDNLKLHNPKLFVNVIIDLLYDIEKKYKHKKVEKNLLDFNDLEHTFLKILKSNINILDKIKYLFVDEYQDTNPIQEEVIKIFEKKCKCVFVGDVKQSIYSFRHTNPIYFIKKYENYKVLSLHDNNYLALTFQENWRSGENICNFVNTIFNENISNYEKLISNNDIQSEVQIYEYENDFSIIEYIINLIEKNVNFSDIAILTRKLSTVTPLLKLLEEYSIPYVLNSETNIFKEPELKRLIFFLKAVYDRHDEIALATALKFILDEYEINKICKIKDKSLYFTLKNLGNLKINDFLDKLDYYYSLSQSNLLAKLVEEIVADFDFINVLLIQKNGRKKVKVIEEFFEYIYEHSFTLDEFLEKYDNEKLISSTSLTYDFNGIKIMTVHKSKGLEFKHVILLGVEKEYNLTDLNKDYIVTSEYGLGLKFFDIEKKEKHSTGVLELCKKALKNKLIDEELRIFYVALTRAKNELTILIKKTKRNSEASFKSILDRYKDIIEFKKIESSNLANSNSFNNVFSQKDDEIVKELKYNFNYVQPDLKLAKTNVTNLQKLLNQNKTSYSSINITESVAMDRGIKFHKFFEDLTYYIKDNRISCSYIEKLKQFDPCEIDICKMAVEAILNYLNKQINFQEKDFQKMILKKEQPFIYNQEGTLIQGVIDFLLIDGKEAYVIDYKTGSRKNYNFQINFYANAVKEILNLNTKKAILWIEDAQIEEIT